MIKTAKKDSNLSLLSFFVEILFYLRNKIVEIGFDLAVYRKTLLLAQLLNNGTVKLLLGSGTLSGLDHHVQLVFQQLGAFFCKEFARLGRCLLGGIGLAGTTTARAAGFGSLFRRLEVELGGNFRRGFNSEFGFGFGLGLGLGSSLFNCRNFFRGRLRSNLFSRKGFRSSGFLSRSFFNRRSFNLGGTTATARTTGLEGLLLGGNLGSLGHRLLGRNNLGN